MGDFFVCLEDPHIYEFKAAKVLSTLMKIYSYPLLKTNSSSYNSSTHFLTTLRA